MTIALRSASKVLQADMEVVLAAVMWHNGDTLKYASAELKASKEVVLAAVTRCGSALMYASEGLKADEEVASGRDAQRVCDLCSLDQAPGR